MAEESNDLRMEPFAPLNVPIIAVMLVSSFSKSRIRIVSAAGSD